MNLSSSMMGEAGSGRGTVEHQPQVLTWGGGCTKIAATDADSLAAAAAQGTKLTSYACGFVL